jgi:MFS family permease
VIWVLLLSVSMVALADALLTTLLGIRMPMAGVDVRIVGLIMSGYWVGYVLGGLTGNRIVERVGRIRTFAGFAGLVTVCVLATTLTPNIGAWAVTRALTGYGCAVLFLAAESWLNGAATTKTRGGIFAGYMVASYFAMGVGQLAIDVIPPMDGRLFALVAMFFAGSLMPLVLLKVTPPALGRPSRFGPAKLWQTAPLATYACAVSGLVTGAFYALAPLYFGSRGFGLHALSWLLASTIFGGLAGQWPLGRLSDVVDRRWVLLGTAAGLCITALLLSIYPSDWGLPGLCGLSALVGVFLSVIYPIAVARANDVVSHDDVVAASGALILVDGVGSVAGPLLAGAIMHWFGGAGLFWVISLGALSVATVCVLSIQRELHCAPQTKPFVVLNTQVAAGSSLHPRNVLPVRDKPE